MITALDCGDTVRLEFADRFQNFIVDSFIVTKPAIKRGNYIEAEEARINLISIGSPDVKEVQPSRNAIYDLPQKEQPFLWDC